MAKCSREQRDRAVDLYIRYERCAADVIRELGYPSRGMLPVWYRERLEEERTGVRPLQARRTLQALRGRAEAGRGGPLPRTRQASETHHARARLSEKP